MNHSVFGEARRISGLDGVRGLAILGVVLEHSWLGVPNVPLTRAGGYGVDLFCILSAFLIASLLLRERRETGKIHFAHFYLRRALRIFPAYFALVALCFGAALVWPTDAHLAVIPSMMPYLLTFTANLLPTMNFLGALWSVCAEEQFYLVWPAIERFLPGRRRYLALGALFLLNLVFAVAAWKQMFPARLHVANMTFQPFVLGVALALLCNDERGIAWLRRRTTRSTLLLVFLALAFCFFGSRNHANVGPKRFLIQLVLVAFLALAALRTSPYLNRGLDWAPLARLGKVSYGVYLVHMPLLWLFGFDRASLLTPVLGLAVSWAVAELSFRFLETPFLRRQERFRPRHRAVAQTDARILRTASR